MVAGFSQELVQFLLEQIGENLLPSIYFLFLILIGKKDIQ